MSANQHQHTPTRSCPHAWCPRLHWTIIAFGVTAFAQTLLAGLVAIVFMAASMAIAFAVLRLQAGKSLTQEVIDEQLEEALGVQLTVRPGWALAAVGSDAFFALSLAATVALQFTQPGATTPTGGGSDMLISIGITVAFVAFGQHAHRKATRPAKPKRLTMPAAADAA